MWPGAGLIGIGYVALFSTIEAVCTFYELFCQATSMHGLFRLCDSTKPMG